MFGIISSLKSSDEITQYLYIEMFLFPLYDFFFFLMLNSDI